MDCNHTYKITSTAVPRLVLDWILRDYSLAKMIHKPDHCWLEHVGHGGKVTANVFFEIIVVMVTQL